MSAPASKRELRALRLKDYLIVAAFSFLVNALLLTGPLYMLHVYDRVLTSFSVPTLIVISLIALVMYITYGFLDGIRLKIMARTATRFDEEASKRLFPLAFRVESDRFSEEQVGMLRNLDTVRNFIQSPIAIAFFDVPYTFFFLAAAWLLHPWFLYMGLAALAVSVTLALANMLWTSARQKPATVKLNAANRAAEAAFQRPDAFIAMGMGTNLEKRWRRQHWDGLNQMSASSSGNIFFTSTSKTFRMFVQSAVLGVGAYLVIHEQLSAGGMIAGSIILGRVMGPFDQVVSSWRNVVEANMAFQSLQSFAERGMDTKRLEFSKLRGEITVEGVSVAVPGTRTMLLKNINFKLPAGSCLVISGPNGSGKTTLLKAIAGARHVPAGRVLIDDADVSHLGPEDRDQNIGFLAQSIDLMDGTIAENIARLDPDFDDEAVLTAARKAGAAPFIAQLDQGYSTPVRSQEPGFSSGQSVLIGLARAMYRDPSVVILDEPQANLDGLADKALIKTVTELKEQKKTIIIATHKDSSFSLADYVLLLVDGEQKVFGPRDEVFKAAAQRKAQIAQGAAGAPNLKPVP